MKPEYNFEFLSKRNVCASCGEQFLMEKHGGEKGITVPHNSWRCATTCLCQDCIMDMAQTVAKHKSKI